MGNTGEELVPAGEVVFEALCGDTGWSARCHVNAWEI